MGEKKLRDQGSGIGDQKVEKVITGSGADVKLIEHDQGMVKCKCTVPCVWRGYRDEGDTVWIEREMIEKDDFIRMHFEEVKSEELRVESFGNADAGRGGRDGTDEGETAADGEGENSQGELELK